MTTETRPKALDLLEQYFVKVQGMGLKHGTVTFKIVYRNGEPFFRTYAIEVSPYNHVD